MFRFLALAVLVTSVACGGGGSSVDAPKSTIDAPKSTIDAPGSGSDHTGSGAFGAACTIPTDTGSDCTGSTECESGCCTTAFNMTGPECSVQCTMKNTSPDPTECPDGSDGTSKCNMKGFCRP
jgi:hypothetical protein